MYDMYQLDSTDFFCIRSRCNPNNIEAVCQRTLSTPDFPSHTISTLLPKADWWKPETACVFLFCFHAMAADTDSIFPGNGRFADIMLSCGATGIW